MNHLLRVHIKTIEELHGAGILEDFRDLRSRGDKLKHVTVILDGSRAMLGGMAHLQGVFQNSDELLDLAVVQGVSGDTTSSGKSFQKVHPFIPLPV